MALVSARHVPGAGMYVTINGPADGYTILLPEHMTVAAIQAYVREIQAWLG